MSMLSEESIWTVQETNYSVSLDTTVQESQPYLTCSQELSDLPRDTQRFVVLTSDMTRKRLEKL